LTVVQTPPVVTNVMTSEEIPLVNVVLGAL
jgi:hypothetical protein